MRCGVFFLLVRFNARDSASNIILCKNKRVSFVRFLKYLFRKERLKTDMFLIYSSLLEAALIFTFLD